MAWSYDEPYVGMQPNYKRLCPFCGTRDVHFSREKYGGKYVFRCFNDACGAVVHFEIHDTPPSARVTYAGDKGSIYRWNRRCTDVE